MERKNDRNNYTLVDRVRFLALKLKSKDPWERVKERKTYGNGVFKEATGKSLKEHFFIEIDN